MKRLEGFSPALLTDLYELTMAYSYWKVGVADQEGTFTHFFRNNPYEGGYVVACGLESVVKMLNEFRFTQEDLAYLDTLEGSDGRPLLEKAFLNYLRDFEFRCDVHAVPEGTVVFPQEPLVRVSGPIVQAQILETLILNQINFQSLIATKGARVAMAAEGGAVLEFGLRRAQGLDGGLSVARATYIGGCQATSNVLAGKIFGIPIKGTHAHSWVMFFEDELEAFRKWGEAMPNNGIFLVDTYDSIEGVKNAIRVGREMRERGEEMTGIRLDSGDLAYLSIEARKLLDEAGFEEAKIVASSDLDEHVITSLKQQGAKIDIWGVGTKMATSYDQPALNGVYKITARRDPEGAWEPKIKLSEQRAKISTPGRQQIRRYRDGGLFIGDMIYDVDRPPEKKALPIVDPMDRTRTKEMPAGAKTEDLLVPVFEQGKQVYDLPELEAIRERALAQLDGFHPGIKRLLNPHEYPVGLEPQLNDLRERMIEAEREKVRKARSE